jgi:hypothetical protein
VIAEARRLVPGKPIRLRHQQSPPLRSRGRAPAFAAEGIPVVTHESNRAFFEGALMAPATMTPTSSRARGARSP